MNRIALARVIAICASPGLVACGSDSNREPADTVSVVADTSTLAATGSQPIGQPGSPCPGTGRWALCSLEKRLEQSGFVLRKQEEGTNRSGFSVKPVVYTLGRARLEVFIYADESALSRDLAKLDTTLAAPRGQTNDWQIPPRFVRSANLAAVLLTRNEQQAERVTLALTAGPPQPGS
jgi:hypothetical protein